MRKQLILLACASSLAIAGCNMTTQEQMVVGGVVGGAAGLLTANALNANTNWTILAVLAGAAAGSLVAKNNATGECAYAKGDGTYYTAPCY
ncbi:glucose-6-phosphate isomerase [Aliiroseovarius subalbicans]|uniref:glucose-6-phosphate isomerase n=1 Tax=Aliiroseovarius subalbicans TaxID=2925840 RepID=UPI001F589E5D|nr:glucose-6-phosphate isomerase [Aliiroseovarius subalbicans]MCI2399008.1 glucose-6-phosphate isomerase [Aliiroseovarius subalbicans]